MRCSSWPGSRMPRILVQSSTARSRSSTSRQTWAKGPLGIGSPSLEAERAADDLFHDLRGPAVDPLDPRVAPQARDLVLLHVAVATVQLQPEVDHPELQLGGPELGAGGVLGTQRPGDLRLDAVVDVDAAQLDLGGDLGEREPVRLEGADRPAEGVAIA